MKTYYHILKRIVNRLCLIFLLGCMFSCKKFIEVEAPITSVNSGNVYKENSNAAAVLTGIFAKMSSNGFSSDLSLYPELSSDNLNALQFSDSELSYAYYKNAMSSTFEASFWNKNYEYIYYANAALEGLSQSTTLDPDVKKRLLGEAHFIRGICYFYLTNFYGKVPLLVSTDYKVNAKLSNSSTEIIYQQIIQDLLLSQQMLDDKYVDATIIKETPNRVRPNRSAATAMLARVYLFTKEYSKAEIEASKVINQSSRYSIVGIDNTFLKNNQETIWALQPVNLGKDTQEGYFFNYPSEGPNSNNYAYLSSDLLESFASGDLRKIKWISDMTIDGVTFFYPTKYKVRDGNASDPKEQSIVLRLAEQYLIRAEARIQQENIEGGVSDLNVLRTRATDFSAPVSERLKLLSATTSKQEALLTVERERRAELFTELGDRWINLKRTGSIDVVMTKAAISKGIIWAPFKAIYPIPNTEIRLNINLIQNPGYQ